MSPIVANVIADIMERAYNDNPDILAEQLAKSTALNTAILSSMTLLIIATDLTGNVVVFNMASEKALGYTAGEVVGKHTPVLWHDALEIVKRAEALSLESGQCVTPGFEVFIHKLQSEPWDCNEWTFIRKDGSRFPVNLTATSLKDEDGDITGYLAIIDDITKRKEAEREREALITELQESEMRHQQFIDAEQDSAVYALDLDGYVVSWNKGAERINGYTAKEIIGQHFSKFYTAADRANGAPEKALEIARTSMKHEVEDWRIRKDGSRMWASVSIAPIRNTAGQIIQFSKVTRDFSQRREAELEREKLIDQLAASNTELERFAYVASHDLQEPLRMITNFSQLILVEYAGQVDQQGREYLSLVSDSAERIQAMVDDLLEYARIGGSEMRLQTVDANKEMRQVVANLATLIAEHQAEITCDDLPVFNGNPVQFVRLLQNLLSNGIKYQFEGQVAKLHVGVGDKGRNWEFSVKDNGIGIPYDLVDQIFEPFRRLHAWGEYKGTGIGLSVCRKIVENHGGNIWATSELGKGSVIYFTISKLGVLAAPGRAA